MSIRSAERRRWSAELAGPDVAALVVHGVGGIGKSTLAVQIASRLSRLAPDWAVTVVRGEVSAADLRAELAGTGLVVLDDFDDNLVEDAGRWTVRDPALAAVLAGWTGKLLITSGHPVTLPGVGVEQLVSRHLGPLTRSGSAELAVSLPGLRLLGEPERDLAWRLTAGHPRAMEYLDALVAAGASFDDLAVRVGAAVQVRTGRPSARTVPTGLSQAAAELAALAAADHLLGELFDRLSAGAQALLVRASVFRVPVVPDVLAARPAHLAECEAAALLTVGPGEERSVHRWTAAELHRRLTEAGQGTWLAAAHADAAGYWLGRAAGSSARGQAHREAGYHRDRAAGLAGPPVAAAAHAPAARTGPAAHARRRSGPARSRLHRIGLVPAAGVLAAILAVEAANGFRAPHLASSQRPAPLSASAPLTLAGQVRDQAAAWVASQVSASAILACDPVMCSALVSRGVPAANLLVLGPAASDPLGSAVVLATAAVRAMFGSRLAAVYAPQVLASFGTGQARIDVRAVAPDGAAAYRSALAADLRARQVAGLQLARDPRLTLPPLARAELVAGQVDARLLVTLAALADGEQVRMIAFGDGDPGSGPGTPLRAAEIEAGAATARAILAFVRAQRPPYLPSESGLAPAPGGQAVVTVRFAAPSPLGLLQAPS